MLKGFLNKSAQKEPVYRLLLQGENSYVSIKNSLHQAAG